MKKNDLYIIGVYYTGRIEVCGYVNEVDTPTENNTSSRSDVVKLNTSSKKVKKLIKCFDKKMVGEIVNVYFSKNCLGEKCDLYEGHILILKDMKKRRLPVIKQKHVVEKHIATAWEVSDDRHTMQSSQLGQSVHFPVDIVCTSEDGMMGFKVSSKPFVTKKEFTNDEKTLNDYFAQHALEIATVARSGCGFKNILKPNDILLNELKELHKDKDKETTNSDDIIKFAKDSLRNELIKMHSQTGGSGTILEDINSIVTSIFIPIEETLKKCHTTNDQDTNTIKVPVMTHADLLKLGEDFVTNCDIKKAKDEHVIIPAMTTEQMKNDLISGHRPAVMHSEHLTQDIRDLSKEEFEKSKSFAPRNDALVCIFTPEGPITKFYISLSLAEFIKNCPYELYQLPILKGNDEDENILKIERFTMSNLEAYATVGNIKQIKRLLYSKEYLVKNMISVGFQDEPNNQVYATCMEKVNKETFFKTNMILSINGFHHPDRTPTELMTDFNLLTSKPISVAGKNDVQIIIEQFLMSKDINIGKVVTFTHRDSPKDYMEEYDKGYISFKTTINSATILAYYYTNSDAEFKMEYMEELKSLLPPMTSEIVLVRNYKAVDGPQPDKLMKVL